ncbi:type VI secretion system baseplate subunit TssG [Tritonibacter scottomollicae]|uniref:type VI secretion system baseplate subunit TssG n=1 Tax=Tritonibacter scottomollicae TaxID=483013 RepID=UPI003BAC42BF
MTVETADRSPPKASAEPGWSDIREREAAAAQGHGFLALLRRIEREAPDGSPRIGRNARLAQSLVRLGQDPFLSFPLQDLARVGLRKTTGAGSIPSVRAQFMGFFGAFGALPLSWTEEVARWFESGDDSFTAFADIFAARFQELFFRVWSNARPITQFDHRDDRFSIWLQAFSGTGTPEGAKTSDVPALTRAWLAPLSAGRVKSPVKLRQMLELCFGAGIGVQIEEMVPTWLRLEDGAQTRMGLGCSRLGADIHLGAQVRTITSKICIHLHLPDMEQYHRFLPGAEGHQELSDLCLWYLGRTFEVDVALWLPEPKLAPAVLGETTQLGWMACIAPDAEKRGQMVRGCRFALLSDDDDDMMQTPRPH